MKSVVCKCTLSVLLLLAVLSMSVNAAQLLIVEEDNCPYCAKFYAEIGHIYPKTEEGKLAPLRSIDLHGEWPEEFVLVKPARYSPTFILVHEGKEIDRHEGYNGDEFFWSLLSEMLAKLPE